MASLRQRRGKYYSRVQWYDELGKIKEKQIPLKTDKKSEAVIRNNEVEKVEDLIKQGENWSFGWMSEGGKKKLIRRSIAESVDDYIAVKRIDGVRQKTIDLRINFFLPPSPIHPNDQFSPWLIKSSTFSTSLLRITASDFLSVLRGINFSILRSVSLYHRTLE